MGKTIKLHVPNPHRDAKRVRFLHTTNPNNFPATNPNNIPIGAGNNTANTATSRSTIRITNEDRIRHQGHSVTTHVSDHDAQNNFTIHGINLNPTTNDNNVADSRPLEPTLTIISDLMNALRNHERATTIVNQEGVPLTFWRQKVWGEEWNEAKSKEHPHFVPEMIMYVIQYAGVDVGAAQMWIKLRRDDETMRDSDPVTVTLLGSYDVSGGEAMDVLADEQMVFSREHLVEFLHDRTAD